MRTSYREKKKVCPRCGIKMPQNVEVCPDCRFDFSKLAIATNADAKRKILRNDRDFIIYTNQLPSDVSYKKLLLMSIFLGLFGGHCFYVGKYIKGVTFVLNMILTLVCVIFNQQVLAVDNGRLIQLFSVIIGIFMIIWICDIWRIAIKKFKVPVAIDLKDDEVKLK